jgi:hypothetical protein
MFAACLPGRFYDVVDRDPRRNPTPNILATTKDEKQREYDQKDVDDPAPHVA